jgi:hypothetical protein
MHILGSMIRLDREEPRVPIPWWHRASLGFETGTQVKVAVTASQAGRPGDLLISALDPNRWDQHIAVSCVRDDAPGVIEQAFDVVHDWNIALAETVTVEGGKLHYVDLICEPYRQPPERPSHEVVAQLKAALDSRFATVQVSSFRPLNTNIAWSRLGTIENGWVTFPGRLGARTWRGVVDSQLTQLNTAAEFDTHKLVLSGDTTVRLFRGVIPRKGALMVSIEHADEPGVLRQLAASLQSAGVNVLSCLLKRGGAAAKNAILVAVCEPAPGVSGQDFESTIRSALSELPQSLRPAWDIDQGLAPEGVIYSHHPGDVVAHVPSHIKARVVERRANFASGKFPIFLSRRFLSAERPKVYAQRIRQVLENDGFVVVEAEVLPGGIRTSLDEVSAAMWAARAGIVLGVDPVGESEVAFSLNLAHELGFMQGQGKPLLLLVEALSRVEKELNAWSNLKGITAPRFSPEFALSDSDPQSIKALVERWLIDIKRGGIRA